MLEAVALRIVDPFAISRLLCHRPKSSSLGWTEAGAKWVSLLTLKTSWTNLILVWYFSCQLFLEWNLKA
jgi:hypothetical protein